MIKLLYTLSPPIVEKKSSSVYKGQFAQISLYEYKC